MSLLDRFLWAIAPVQGRSISLVLGSLALFTVSGALAMLVDLPRAIDALLALIMLASWFVGVCGMVGYFRWLFSPSTYRQSGTDSTRPKD